MSYLYADERIYQLILIPKSFSLVHKTTDERKGPREDVLFIPRFYKLYQSNDHTLEGGNLAFQTQKFKINLSQSILNLMKLKHLITSPLILCNHTSIL
jgi:hypothetical protein